MGRGTFRLKGFIQMRLRNLLVICLGVLLLGACETFDGLKKDLGDANRWAHGHEDTAMERGVGRIPTGYVGQNRRVLLKPPSSEISSSGLIWSDYTEKQARAAEPKNYNDSVSVFPIDDQIIYDSPQPGADNMPVTTLPTEYDYGTMVQQVFFAYGSSYIPTPDRRKLQDLAKSLMGTPVSLTVVGHASKNVNGVTDPMQKKLINFEMAQKRANAVTQQLKKAGLSPEWVKAVSKGDEEPNLIPGSRLQEEADRRVEIYRQ